MSTISTAFVSTRAAAGSLGRPAAFAGPAQLAIAGAVAAVATVAGIGADARWLVAIGRGIVADGISDGVPYASAPSGDWPNVLVLAELVFYGLWAAFSDHGLLLAHIFAVAAGLASLATDMRRAGATGGGSALVLLVASLGGASALLAVRLQLFSLVFFPLLVLILRAEARRPSRRVWLLIPLMALWSNLHGAVLVGVAVAGAYLLLHRAPREPLTAAGALIGCLFALCATPALLRTPEYYLGVLNNEAAQQGYGLWARVSATSPFDLLLIGAAVILVALAVRSRPPLWELVALAGLAGLTLQASRSGIWLVLFAAPSAARTLALPSQVRARVGTALATLSAIAAVVGVAAGPTGSTGNGIVRDAIALAQGTPILADPVLAEQVAVQGGTVWIANPIDAFRPADQRLYLDWLRGRPSGDGALAQAAKLVLVGEDSAAQRRAVAGEALHEISRSDGVVLYRLSATASD